MTTDGHSAVLHLLNILCFVLHTLLIAFNLTGWIFPRSRRLHRICVLATLFSWFGMGAWKGLGYCLCTDWHFRIRRDLGLPVEVSTYVQLMFQVFAGIRISRMASDILAAGGLLLIVIATVVVRVQELRQGRQTSAGSTSNT